MYDFFHNTDIGIVILTFIEEVVRSLIHGEELTAAIARAAARDALQLTAKVFIMLLILLPYVGLRSLGEALGEDRLLHLFVAPGGRLPADQKPQDGVEVANANRSRA